MQILGEDQLEPGKQGYVQFRGELTLACARGDRFVVRSYSPMVTIGGGTVLDASPARHKRRDPAVLAALAAKERGSPEDLLESWLQTAPVGGLLKELPKTLGISESAISEASHALVERGSAVPLGTDRLIHASLLAAATDRALRELSEFHAANPLRPGMPKEELRGSLGRAVDARAFAALLARWQSEGVVAADPATVRSADFAVQLAPGQRAILDRIAESYRKAGFNVPSVEEVAEEIGEAPEMVSTMIRVGQDQGLLFRIVEGFYYHRDTLERSKKIVLEQIQRHGSITVSQFRDLTGSSRKYALPVMEYFDSIRFTRRVGDERVLVER
jgi:selenocysteine-specific elongation factor